MIKIRKDYLFISFVLIIGSIIGFFCLNTLTAILDLTMGLVLIVIYILIMIRVKKGKEPKKTIDDLDHILTGQDKRHTEEQQRP